MKKLCFNTKGVTLVELVIVSAILVIVVTLGFSLYSFGTKTYNKGTDRANIQQNVNLTAEFITREVRNATPLELLVSPVTFDDTSWYIYQEGTVLKYRSPGGGTVNKSDSVIEAANGISFELKNAPNGKYILKFVISGAHDDNTYSLESEVLLNNLGSGTAGTGNVIKYKRADY